MSAFTAVGREGSIYTRGTKPADCVSFYATKFDTVEIDSTFYRTPAVSKVNGWYEKIPKGCLFAARVPQKIISQEEDSDSRVRQQPLRGLRARQG
jgi:uncharacterized protein YecE (DUF72 family)